MKKTKRILTFVIMVFCALTVFTFSSSAAGKWISTWSTAVTEIGVEGYDHISAYVGDVCTRTVITPSASGSKIRVKFSNVYGKTDLVIDRVTVAVSTGDSGIDTSTLKYLTFSDYPGVTIPAGKEIYSDSVIFDTEAGKDIVITTYIREFSEVRTMGLSGGSTYLKVGGGTEMVEAVDFNLLSDLELEEQWVYDMLDKLLGSIINQGTLEIPASYNFIEVVPIIAQVDVLNPNDDAFSVVVIGDSTISDNFPLYLGEAINAQNITDIGVADKGLIGNCLLEDGLGYGSLVYGEALVDRMKKDIIGLDGKNKANVKYVIIKAGLNDIIYPVSEDIKEMYPGIKQPTADDIIAGYKKVFSFCHKNDIKVIAVGITQWKGNDRDYLGTGSKYIRTSKQFKKDWQIALDVNEWLSKTSLHDGYVSYNKISENPKDTAALLPEYTVDGAHPADNLQRIWADEFPLSLIGVSSRAVGVSISDTKLTVYKGSSKTLKAKVLPEDAKNRSVKWTSSNPKVATVNSKGKVTGKSNGTAVITVKTADKGYNGKGYSATCKVTVKTKPESIKISGKTSTIYTTKSLALTAKVSPSGAELKGVKWSSSNEKVATVNKKGVVTAVGAGKVVITAKSSDNSKVKGTYKITVKKKVQVQAIYLNYPERTRYINTKFTLVPTFNPEKATFTDVTWKSSDSKVAKVDKNGKVTALKPGVAIITCKSVDNPKVTATCIVTVKVKTTGVKLPTKKLTLYLSQTKTLKAEILPSNATSKSVTWSSSDKKVATVSKTGKITAKKPGKSIITVKTKSGGYKAQCTVTVKKYVAVKSFSLNKKSVSVDNGKTYTLKAVFSPSNASVKDVVWKSSDKSIATVSSKGVVKGIKPGTCTVTCRSKETGKTVKCTVKVKKVSVKAVLFDEKTYTVKDNGTLQLKAHISPVNATNKKLKWKSNRPEYVKVSSKGKVTGMKAGKTATITVTTVDGKKVASCKVKVEKVPLKSIKLNKSTANVYTGGTVTLSPKFTPSKPTNQKVKWTSSDTKLATVSDSGVVKALKPGTVIITCISDDGGRKATCKVVIRQAIKPTGVKLNKESVEANVGAQFNLVATIEPENASNKKVSWTSTNPSVATVSANGKVTALKEGLTYIRVTTVDGVKTDSCRIDVVS